jgi:hypothetical protein
MDIYHFKRITDFKTEVDIAGRDDASQNAAN